ncbi:MAG TPA: type II secretion system F family protein [Burkholderiaceae bacterium]|jgi:tight adherence protein B|nr:type II secretion system F family protein [Burkholderiaceae bacterium]
MDTSYILFAVLLFVAVVLALEGAYSMWASKSSAEAKRIAARLRTIGDPVRDSPLTIARVKRRGHWSWLDDHLIALLPRGEHLMHYLETSGTGTTAGEVVMASTVLGLIGFFVPMMLAKPLVFSLVGFLLTAALPWWRLSRKRTQRIRLFEKQIPEALDLMGRAMRAGHAFPTAVQMVGDEMADPIGQEFRTLFDETNYGLPQQEALLRLAQRVPVPDLGYFVVAVTIQRESGGNLAELLDNIASIVRARLKLLGEVRTLSAEGRLSAWILLALPFVTGGIINVMAPSFMAVLWTDPAGIRLVGAALFMILLGVVWMRNIIHIRV